MKSLMTKFSKWAQDKDERENLLTKKTNTCCFCNRKYLSKWGATCEDTGKTLCIDCIVMLYNGILDQLKLGTNTDREADGIPHKEEA